MLKGPSNYRRPPNQENVTKILDDLDAHFAAGEEEVRYAVDETRAMISEADWAEVVRSAQALGWNAEVVRPTPQFGFGSNTPQAPVVVIVKYP
jgi:hypothetical protein